MDRTGMTRALRDGRSTGIHGLQSRRSLLRRTGGAALAGGLLAGGLPAPPTVAAANPALVGSWFVNRSATATPTPSTSLTRWTMAFMADGTLVAQVAPIGPAPGGRMTVASIASGVWAPLADGTFGFTHLQVRYDPQTTEAFGVIRWLGSVTLDPEGDTFAMSYRVNVLDPDTLATERQGDLLDGKGMRIVLDPTLSAMRGQDRL